MKTLALLCIKGYKKTLSPQTGVFRFLYYSPLITLQPGQTGCVFEKSCSTYAQEQYMTQPFLKATRNTLSRIKHCHK